MGVKRENMEQVFIFDRLKEYGCRASNRAGINGVIRKVVEAANGGVFVQPGDMNLVGPRPLLMRYLDRYTPEQAKQHEVKPGITAWTQQHGARCQFGLRFQL